MTQIFLASTPYTVASMVAAAEEGRFDGYGPERRILLLYSSAFAPEAVPTLAEGPSMAPLLKRFDDVLSWNELIHPYHAHEWSPHAEDTLLLARLLRESWGLGTADPLLVLEAIHVNPALALTTLFPESPVHVVSDGLMTYGPTRNKLPRQVGSRVEQLLHVDLVPGLTPMLLAEHDVSARHVHPGVLRSVLAEVAAESARLVGPEVRRLHGRAAMVLGQYLSALGILTDAEEQRLNHELIVRTARATGGPVLFKPHPAIPTTAVRRLVEGARRAGAEVTVSAVPAPVEVMYEALAPTLVAGCFSTGLATASRLFGLPVAAHGTGLVLDRFRPYQNSNRMPATIVHALLPRLGAHEVTGPRADEATYTGQRLVNAVAYCMQPALNPGLRPDAEWLVRTQDEETVRQYVGREQVLTLALVGRDRPLLHAASAARRVVGRARSVAARFVRQLSH